MNKRNAAAAVFILLLLFLPATVNAASKKGTVITDGLNVRAGAGTTFDILKMNDNYVRLDRNTQVTITGEEAGGWYKVDCTYKGKKVSGYVASMYVSINKNKNILASNTNIAAKLRSKQRVYARPSKKSAYMKHNGRDIQLKKGTGVKVTGVYKVSKKRFYEIEYTYKKTSYKGYVNSLYVQVTAKKINSGITAKTGVYTRTSKTAYVKVKKKRIKLKSGKKVIVISEKTVKGTKWFRIKYTYNGKNKKSWLPADYVMFVSGKEKTSPQPAATAVPTVSPTPRPAVALSDAEFEAHLTEQGFPESYKAGLRALHSRYPYWQFNSVKTGLDWTTAVEKESVNGKSLLPNSRAVDWKSHEQGAYNWETDTYVVFDGTQWVAASKEGVAYYMDPRNFLSDKGIFMFEALAYEAAYQKAEGVATILKNSYFADSTYTYIDDTGNQVTRSYADTIMEAAAISGVSPYHLASRIRQEVVTGTSSVSNSVSGTVAGYEGIYNFYNIGASDSAGGGAVVNGLKFASGGNTYMRPWNNPYKAIVGGAQYIGSNYISRGQNTLYLERFNVTDNNTYDHQYMTNVGAAYSEANKVYTAYKDWMATVPIMFYIPVYDNMPQAACGEPKGNLNRNNYLSSLTVTGLITGTPYVFTPEFAVSHGGAQVYTVNVPLTETSVRIDAASVNKNAVISGTGDIQLQGAQTTVNIQVTAQNGTTRNYTIIINMV